MSEIVSSCCGSTPTEYCNEDTGFCAECRDHCEYLSECDECGEYDCSCVHASYNQPWNVIAKGGVVLKTLPNHDAAIAFMRLPEMRGRCNHAEPAKDTELDADPVNTLLGRSAAYLAIMCMAAWFLGFLSGSIGQ